MNEPEPIKQYDMVAKKRPTRPLDFYGYVKYLNDDNTAVVVWYRNGETTTSREFIHNLIDMKNSGHFILDLKRRFNFAKILYFAGRQATLEDCIQTHEDWIRAIQTRFPSFRRRFYQDM